MPSTPDAAAIAEFMANQPSAYERAINPPPLCTTCKPPKRDPCTGEIIEETVLKEETRPWDQVLRDADDMKNGISPTARRVLDATQPTYDFWNTFNDLFGSFTPDAVGNDPRPAYSHP